MILVRQFQTDPLPKSFIDGLTLASTAIRLAASGVPTGNQHPVRGMWNAPIAALGGAPGRARLRVQWRQGARIVTGYDLGDACAGFESTVSRIEVEERH